MALSTLFVSRSAIVTEQEVRSVFNQIFDGVLVERVVVNRFSESACNIVVHMFQDRPATVEAKKFYDKLAETKTLEVYYSYGRSWTVVPLPAKTLEYKSLCIPFAHISTTEKYVHKAFNSLFDATVVERVELKHKVNEQGIPYYTVFIHMYQDAPVTEDAELFYADIAAKDAVKGFIKIRTGYRDHFWKVVLNKSVRPVATPTATPAEPAEAPVVAVEPAELKSVCIPHVMKNTTEEDIKKVFDRVFGGEFVERIDLKQKTDSKGLEFQTAFIHFYQERAPTDASNKFYAELYAKDAKKESVRVLTGVRNYFWKVVPNKAAVRV
jgi:hypothetical protein